MKILCVDVGTGTQDILLYDSDKEIENCLKMVMPSPTLRVAQRVKAGHAHWRRDRVDGRDDGRRAESLGGDGSREGGLQSVCHARSGAHVRRRTGQSRAHGHSRGQRRRSAPTRRRGRAHHRAARLRLSPRSNWPLPPSASISIPDGLALAVFDHGNAPAGYSDRQFRFDYLEQRLRAENRLSAFAHKRGELPDHLTRLKAVEASTQNFDGEVMLMDTAPAAVLGALLDPVVSAHQQLIVCNVGNFHTLAFRLGAGGIEGVFEHHTGEITREQTRRLHRQD